MGKETLEDIYTRFNVNRPEDFNGHSLSVGDIIGIRQDSKLTAHYVDGLGFEEIPDFFLDRSERHEQEQAAQSTAPDIISELRGGKVAEITEKPEEEKMIGDAWKRKFSNIRLQYNGQSGFHLTADTDNIKGAIITVFGQNEQAVRDYLAKNALETRLVNGENPIHFALLGNGVTVYDTSKWDKEASDYPIIAHISNEGIVKYRVDKASLKAEDISLIEKHAAMVKQEFTENWNKLSVDTRYSRIQDAANDLAKPQWEVFFADKIALGAEEAVKKYEHALILASAYKRCRKSTLLIISKRARRFLAAKSR